MQFDAALTQDFRDTMFKGTSLLTFVPTNTGSAQFQIRVPLADANSLEMGKVYSFEVKESATQPPAEEI